MRPEWRDRITRDAIALKHPMHFGAGQADILKLPLLKVGEPDQRSPSRRAVMSVGPPAGQNRLEKLPDRGPMAAAFAGCVAFIQEIHGFVLSSDEPILLRVDQLI